MRLYGLLCGSLQTDQSNRYKDEPSGVLGLDGITAYDNTPSTLYLLRFTHSFINFTNLKNDIFLFGGIYSSIAHISPMALVDYVLTRVGYSDNRARVHVCVCAMFSCMGWQGSRYGMAQGYAATSFICMVYTVYIYILGLSMVVHWLWFFVRSLSLGIYIYCFRAILIHSFIRIIIHSLIQLQLIGRS